MSKTKELIKSNKILYFIFHYCKGGVFWIYERMATICWQIKCMLVHFHIIKDDPRFRRIRKMRDLHEGERCFIVATGPSVTESDLEALKDEFTISMNSIVNVMDSVDFLPSIYMIQDYSVYARVREKYDMIPNERIYIGITNSLKYFAGGISLADVKEFTNVNLFHLDVASNIFHINFDKRKLKPKFSWDCGHDIKDGTTITYSAVQLAAYMGFKDIYLIGVDCNYTGKIRHIGECNPDEDFSDVAEDIVYNFNNVFGYASEELKKRDIYLYNATRGGNLNTVPRVEFDKIINS